MKSRILNIYGEPFTFEAELQTEQESRLSHLQRHYSEHPASGLTPAKAARILRAAEQGDLIAQAELAEDMEEKDAHIQSELGKRRGALLNVDWQIAPPPDATAEEQRSAAMIEEILTDAVWLDDCIFDATDAILKGFSCQEIEWESVGGLNIIKNVHWRDPAWFMTPQFERNNLRLRDGTAEGVPLQQFGWVKHIARAKTGYLSRIGLVRTLIWPFLFKNYSLRDFAEFLEIYGLPLRLGKFPEGASDNEKKTLLRAVMSIGHNAGGIIPRGMEIEFQKAAEGSEATFMAMIEWAEKSMSKTILGGTLTSQADGASSTNALGKVHNDVRLEVRNADLRRLEATLTRDIVYPLYALNAKAFNDVRRIPRLVFDIAESEDLNDFADGLAKLVDIGFSIPKQWAHEKLQVPIAAKDEEVLAKNPQNMTAYPEEALNAKISPNSLQISPNPSLLKRGTPEGATQEGQKIAVLSLRPDPDDLIDELEPDKEAWQEIVDPMLKPIIQALEEGGYEYAQDRIAELYTEMDDTELERMLTRAIFVSDLLGRAYASN